MARSGCLEVTPERAKAAGLDELPTVLGAAAAERFLSALAAIDPYHHRDVPAAHWYVMVVGVAPEEQGKGIGRALLQPFIKRADTAGEPCYLETAQPENVGFYERLGFRRVVDMVEPQTGLRLWTFRRDPAAPHELAREIRGEEKRRGRRLTIGHYGNYFYPVGAGLDGIRGRATKFTEFWRNSIA